MILALDPSLRMTGWLLVDNGIPVSCGTIATEPDAKKRRIFAGDDDSRRCKVILDALEDLVTTACVTELLVEQPAGARGAGGHKCQCGGQHVPGMYRSAKSEGMVLALVTAFGVNNGFDIQWRQPTDVKFALLKARSGSKDAMIAAATRLLDERGWKLDLPKARLKLEAVADAIGVAVAGGALR